MSNGKVKVTMDIYSGRVNPQWELSDAEAAELEKFYDAPLLSGEVSEPPGLGYRGFVLQYDGDSMGKPVSVFNGQMLKDHGMLPVVPYHEDKGLEEWLFGLAEERGYKDVVARVRGQRKS